MKAFGISVQQASLDLIGYDDRGMGNLVHDWSQGTYVRGKHFMPQYITPSADEYLTQPCDVDQGLILPEQSWIIISPSHGVTPTPTHGVAPESLRSVLAAIHAPAALQVTYQSMSRPEPRTGWIEPLALAFDGVRWLARAFRQTNQVFKDFLLSRIVEIGAQGPVTADQKDNAAWHSEVVLENAPHPVLSSAQRRAIEMDFDMAEGRAQIPVGQLLLFFASKRLGLDTNPVTRRPQDQQILLLNSDEIAHAGGREIS